MRQIPRCTAFRALAAVMAGAMLLTGCASVRPISVAVESGDPPNRILERLDRRHLPRTCSVTIRGEGRVDGVLLGYDERRLWLDVGEAVPRGVAYGEIETFGMPGWSWDDVLMGALVVAVIVGPFIFIGESIRGTTFGD